MDKNMSGAFGVTLYLENDKITGIMILISVTNLNHFIESKKKEFPLEYQFKDHLSHILFTDQIRMEIDHSILHEEACTYQTFDPLLLYHPDGMVYNYIPLPDKIAGVHCNVSIYQDDPSDSLLIDIAINNLPQKEDALAILYSEELSLMLKNLEIVYGDIELNCNNISISTILK